MKFLAKMNKREKYLLFVTVAVVAGTLIYFYLAEPMWKYWLSLDSTIDMLTRQLNRNQIMLSREKEIIEEYKAYEAKLKFEGSDQEKTAQILKVIENAASTNKVHINDIKPQQIKDDVLYKFYVIDLEAESDIMALAKFIYDLQISQQVLRVSRVQVSARSSKPDVLKIEMLITKILLQ